MVSFIFPFNCHLTIPVWSIWLYVYDYYGLFEWVAQSTIDTFMTINFKFSLFHRLFVWLAGWFVVINSIFFPSFGHYHLLDKNTLREKIFIPIESILWPDQEITCYGKNDLNFNQLNNLTRITVVQYLIDKILTQNKCPSENDSFFFVPLFILNSELWFFHPFMNGENKNWCRDIAGLRQCVRECLRAHGHWLFVFISFDSIDSFNHS